MTSYAGDTVSVDFFGSGSRQKSKVTSALALMAFKPAISNVLWSPVPLGYMVQFALAVKVVMLESIVGRLLEFDLMLGLECTFVCWA